ncbi:MAG TPA: DUF6305 family protein [Vicinamibacterales bacterium]|nr:DUF6305 family protein [Vicinamibacterales bacterium]HOQ61278.1 DUF6305 family protein [Vicinamibacterales bacterium]HPK70763.1 DUF6305 family protein [Vicinamibacterales bacterium]HPW19406.1 DUF6305 family protein [Vicinamibacterales bacterium]
MRHTRLVSLVAVTALMSFAASAAAAVSGAAPPKGQTPLLITNAGQGPGAKMARLLLQRTGAVSDFDYNAEPQPADLAAKPYKTLMVVLGSTAKGLGASGITIDDEIARLNAMMAEAKKLKLQIVCVLLEGKTRRGKPGGADERCIDAVAPFAHALVVKKDGNEDGRFDAIAKKTGAPLTFIDDAVDFGDVVKAMYAK